jgi:hypothetical protein
MTAPDTDGGLELRIGIVPRPVRARPLGRTARRLTVMVLVLAGAAGVVLDLASGSARTWFGHHQFVTAIISSSILLGATYLVIESRIAAVARERWRIASVPVLDQILQMMISSHGALDRMVAGKPAADAGVPEAVARYQDAFGRYDGMLAGTPELVEIYSRLARHLASVESLVDICETRKVPSWDPVDLVNSNAREATSAIGSYLLAPIPVPSAVRGTVTTTQTLFGGRAK